MSNADRYAGLRKLSGRFVINEKLAPILSNALETGRLSCVGFRESFQAYLPFSYRCKETLIVGYGKLIVCAWLGEW